MNIAYIGNFGCDFSTESHIKWTLEEKLGHHVVPLQENKIITDEVVAATRERGCKLLLWTHTHGPDWEMTGNISRDQMLNELRRSGIKTASFHLDRYRGLRILDGREDRVGNDAFWRTDIVFTADGGNQEWFAERCVNHVWLPPGIVEKEAYFGKPKPQYTSPLAFFGADGYHDEYPFRGRMCSRLKEKYGSNFRIYQGIRRGELNDAMASVKVVVGDSCFAGSDRYWSDRVPESLGRGAFLIFPRTPGLEIPGLVTYTPGDINDLIKKIDYWLDEARDTERKEIVKVTQSWVKENATYTNRMKFLLDYMGVA